MKSSRLLIGVLAVLALGGCGTKTTRIEAKDNPVFLPSVRASYNFTKGSEAPSEPQEGHAIELGMWKARGGDSQAVSAGQPPVILGDTRFDAPQQLTNDFDLSYEAISWRWRTTNPDRSLRAELLAGLGRAGLDLTVASPTQQASRHFSTLGPQGGVGVVWSIRPTISVQARIAAFISANEGVNRTRQAELFFVKALHERLTVRAGYAGWEARGHALLTGSDFRLRFSGPAVGLDLHFGP